MADEARAAPRRDPPGPRAAHRVEDRRHQVPAQGHPLDRADDRLGHRRSLTPRIILRHALGTEHVDVGSTVATGTSATAFDVQAGDGTRFAKGDFIAVTISGEPEWTQITNVSTDPHRVARALLGARDVRGGAAALQLRPGRVALQQPRGVASLRRRRLRAGHRERLLRRPRVRDAGVRQAAVDVPVAHRDELHRPFDAEPQRRVGHRRDGRRVRVDAEGLPRDQRLARLVARVRARPSVRQRLGARPRPRRDADRAQRRQCRRPPTAVKANIKLRFDSAYPAAFSADTAYRLIIVQKIGTGATASFWIWSLPPPASWRSQKLTKVGARLYMELMLEGTPSTLITDAGETGAAADRIHSPFFVAFG